MISIVIIGAGNVATHLFRALISSKNFQVVQVYNRTKENLGFFKDKVDTTSNIEQLKVADIYILALKDDIISTVAKTLPNKDALIVHTSGATSMKALTGMERGGVFYPLQTFSKTKEVDFSQIPICIEASHRDDEVILEKLSMDISKNVYKINSDQRKKLHVAAVFVSNFANYMYTIGEDICKNNNIPFEILHPLIIETADKATKIGPVSSQTGPAKRNDEAVIEKHLSLISNEQRNIYKIITHAIQGLYGKEL